MISVRWQYRLPLYNDLLRIPWYAQLQTPCIGPVDPPQTSFAISTALADIREFYIRLSIGRIQTSGPIVVSDIYMKPRTRVYLSDCRTDTLLNYS